MLADVHAPTELQPHELDHYLADGWFRMGQTIFTTNFLRFHDNLYSAIWLRVALAAFEPTKAQQQRLRHNAVFRHEIKKAQITHQHEVLFEQYKQGITFETSGSVYALLFGQYHHNVFNTYEIDVYDGDQLIASGFFDLGQASGAGITSFYDPAYKKYSLGKYLILLKMLYCKQLGFTYFYPGYFVPGYKLFDYKLDLGRDQLQYLRHCGTQWVDIARFDSSEVPLSAMHQRLGHLHQALTQAGQPCAVMRYEFFDGNLVPDLNGMDLVDYPVFLATLPLPAGSTRSIAVFDVRDGHYYLLSCTAVSVNGGLAASTTDRFASHILKRDDTLFLSPDAHEMATFIASQRTTQLQQSMPRWR